VMSRKDLDQAAREPAQAVAKLLERRKYPRYGAVACDFWG
jgi:hypothetical protein